MTALWTPSRIRPLAWFDAADSNTITEAGGAVSEWRDKSGNGEHVSQAVSANQPAYDAANNLIYFSGQESLERVSRMGLEANPDLSVIIMADQVSTISNIDYHWGVGTLPIGEEGILSGTIGSDGLAWRYNNGNRIYQPVTFGDQIRAWHRSGGSTYGDSDLRVDGVEQSVTSGTNPTLSPTSTAEYMTVGASYGSNGTLSSVDIKVKEVVFLNSNDQDEIELVEGYLAWKWGQEALLPANHPYKNAAPTIDDAWTPDAIEPQYRIAWWRADDAASLDLSGSAVINWRDQWFGHEATQSGTGNEPELVENLFGLLPGLDFVDGRMALPSAISEAFANAAVDGVASVALVRATSVSSSNQVIGGNGPGCSFRHQCNFTVAPANVSRLRMSGTDGAIYNETKNFSADNSTPFVTEVFAAPNGEEAYPAINAEASNLTELRYSPAQFPIAETFFGAENTTTTGRYQVCEHILVNAAGWAKYRRKLEGYLAWREGGSIPPELPEDHYKYWEPLELEPSTDTYEAWTPKQLGSRVRGWWDPAGDRLDNGTNVSRLRDLSGNGRDLYDINGSSDNWPALTTIDGVDALELADATNEKFLQRNDSLGLTDEDYTFVGVYLRKVNGNEFVFSMTGGSVFMGAAFSPGVMWSSLTSNPSRWRNNGTDIDDTCFMTADIRRGQYAEMGDARVTNQGYDQECYQKPDNLLPGPFTGAGYTRIGRPPGDTPSLNRPSAGVWLVIEGALTESELDKIQGWLAMKHGRRDLLPIDHPFAGDTPRVGDLWSPAQLDPYLWYDPNSPSTVTASGGQASRVDDKSPNGAGFALRQTVSLDQPAYDPATGLLTADGNDFMTTNENIGIGNVSSYFISARYADTSSLRTLVNSNNSNERHVVFRSSPPSSLSATQGLGINVDSGFNPEQEWFIAAPGFRGDASSFLRVNGVGYGPDDGGDFEWNNATMRLFTNSSRSNHFLGDFREFILFDRALSTDDYERMEGYLAWRPALEYGDYDLVDNLDPSHPFKDRPPFQNEPDPSAATLSGYGSYGRYGVQKVGRGHGMNIGFASKPNEYDGPPGPQVFDYSAADYNTTDYDAG